MELIKETTHRTLELRVGCSGSGSGEGATATATAKKFRFRAILDYKLATVTQLDDRLKP